MDFAIWEMTKTATFALLTLPKWNEFIRKLIEENSPMLQNATLKDIANYLRIAPSPS